MTTTVATHLESFEQLLANADKAVADIDQRIEKLEANIARLKRMREMLAPTPPKPKKVPLRDDTDISHHVTAIRQALVNSGRPMTCKEISDLTEIPFTMIGKYVDRSPAVLTKMGRLIALKE